MVALGPSVVGSGGAEGGVIGLWGDIGEEVEEMRRS